MSKWDQLDQFTDRSAKFWGGSFAVSARQSLERPVRQVGPVEWNLRRLMGGLSARLPFERWRGIWFANLVKKRCATVSAMSEDELTAAVAAVRPRLLRHGFTFGPTVEAFALICEVSSRTLGMAPYPVQIRGGYGMVRGRLIEMATGEGKTLTALLPAAAAALAGLRVHVVTVNDYLAARDCEELAPAFERLGLNVGVITHDDEPAARREKYQRNIVYINNKEVVFDYLRDRAAILAAPDDKRHSRARQAVDRFVGRGLRGAPPVTNGLNFAIVDEADSILIDEALTPLILAAKTDAADDVLYQAALRVAQRLEEGVHFTVLSKEKYVRLTDDGEIMADRLAEVERERGANGLWLKRQARLGLVRSGLAALHLYQLGRDYVVVEGKVQIVDDTTGRILPDRTWQAGLHQLIEAKEQVALTEDQNTIARITYQRFFSRYRRLSGMSGTVMEVAAEIAADYQLPALKIPTHRLSQREHLTPHLYLNREDQFAAIVAAAKTRARDHGQPVLIGARSVETSEQIGTLFAAQNVPHVILNAVQDEEEAEIVARAGQAGVITIATNMAGRGTDIKPSAAALEAGGLHVILTELHESPRIDRQLFGRAGRQGQIGSAQIIMSLDDPLLHAYAQGVARWLGQRFKAVDGQVPPVLARLLRFVVQRLSEKHRATIRRDTRKQDDRLVKSLGLAGQSE